MSETITPKRDKQPNPDQSVVAQIMEALGETAGQAEAQLRRVVRALGPEQALAVLAQAEEVEANGGMLLPDGSRKRTKGGVYFRLVKDQLTPEQRLKVFPPWHRRKPRPPQASDPTAGR
jgi:hypothetical protein